MEVGQGPKVGCSAKGKKILLIIMFNYLHFKSLCFLLTVSRTKLTFLLWVLLVSMYQLSKPETCPTLTSVMSKKLALQQVALQLQAASADLWTFVINTLPLLKILFALLDGTEFMVPVKSLSVLPILLYCLVFNFCSSLVQILYLILV
jgi:hypothetical protein